MGSTTDYWYLSSSCLVLCGCDGLYEADKRVAVQSILNRDFQLILIQRLGFPNEIFTDVVRRRSAFTPADSFAGHAWRAALISSDNYVGSGRGFVQSVTDLYSFSPQFKLGDEVVSTAYNSCRIPSANTTVILKETAAFNEPRA